MTDRNKLETIISLVEDGIDVKVAMESTVATSIASFSNNALGVASPNVPTLSTKKPDEVDTDTPEDQKAKEVDSDNPVVDTPTNADEKSESYLMMTNSDQASTILAKRKNRMMMLNEATTKLNQIYSEAQGVEDIIANKDTINFCISIISDNVWKLTI